MEEICYKEKEKALTAIKEDGEALRFASKELQNDKDFLQSISNDED